MTQKQGGQKDKQSNKQTLVDCTKHILETEDLADLKFLVGDSNRGDQEVYYKLEV